MTQENIDPNQNISNESQAGSGDSTQIFDTLVGDDKRYKTPDDLAKGKVEADQFIEQLKRENAQMREDLGKRLTEEQVRDIIKRESEARESAEYNQNSQETTPAVKPEDLEKLIASTLEKNEAQKAAESNMSKVLSSLTEKFGEASKARDFINEKAAEVGLPVEELKRLAMRSPDAFYNLVGFNKNQGNKGAPMSGQVNSEALSKMNSQSQVKEGSWEYYQELRKTNPRKYYSPKVQNEIFKMAKANGPEYLKK